MKPYRMPLVASVRLPAVVITLAMMTSCHSRGPICLTADCIPYALEGTLSGLVGSNLYVSQTPGQLPAAFSGTAANGTQVAFGVGYFNAPYNLTIVRQPTSPAQTCVLTNGSGPAGLSAVSNIVVTCTTNPPRFAYVANRGSNDISAYSVDTATGTLAPMVGSPFAAGNFPVAIAVDQTGHFAYVVNQMDATLSAFSIDRDSGALNEVAGSPFATGLSPTSVAIDPSSSFVYVANGGAASVSAYAITASGSLTEITGSPYATGNSPSSVAVDPVGVYVYVTNKADGTFSGFSIQEGAGNLMVEFGSPFAAGLGPQAVATDPIGIFVYVANGGLNSL